MNHYLSIQNSIDYIELNLTSQLTIESIAEQAYYSAFHFQRVFQAILGYSVKEYIRLRRLTKSLEDLSRHNESVLEISLKYNYSSQEAFTRAFKKTFLVTPAAFRKNSKMQGCLKDKIVRPVKLNPSELDLDQFLSIKKPRIVELDETYIIGRSYKTHLEAEKYFRDIPQFYDDFGQNAYYLDIPNRNRPDFAYGINCDYQSSGAFNFLVGESVTHLNTLPSKKLVTYTIPPGRYAEFELDGCIENAQNTWKYIYSVWLMTSKYTRRDGPDFEVIDVCRTKYPDNIKMNIYIPVK